jgi:hypothetical protein
VVSKNCVFKRNQLPWSISFFKHENVFYRVKKGDRSQDPLRVRAPHRSSNRQRYDQGAIPATASPARVSGENAIDGSREFLAPWEHKKIFDLVAARTGLKDDDALGGVPVRVSCSSRNLRQR